MRPSTQQFVNKVNESNKKREGQYKFLLFYPSYKSKVICENTTDLHLNLHDLTF
jgi:hypothetical protein